MKLKHRRIQLTVFRKKIGKPPWDYTVLFKNKMYQK